MGYLRGVAGPGTFNGQGVPAVRAGLVALQPTGKGLLGNLFIPVEFYVEYKSYFETY